MSCFLAEKTTDKKSYGLYHFSLNEWLGNSDLSGEFACSVKRGHVLLASVGLVRLCRLAGCGDGADQFESEFSVRVAFWAGDKDELAGNHLQSNVVVGPKEVLGPADIFEVAFHLAESHNGTMRFFFCLWC